VIPLDLILGALFVVGIVLLVLGVAKGSYGAAERRDAQAAEPAVTRLDPVTRETREAVFARDNWTCIAPQLGRPTCRAPLTLDHIQETTGGWGGELRRTPRTLSACAGITTWTAGRPHTARCSGPISR
jgi:hypothetical protein